MAMAEELEEHGMIRAVEKVGEEEEIWFNHYCSSHQILLVGEGDFSFSLCLALSFGSGSNILASSLDSYDILTEKYKQANSNLVKLDLLGASILHGVDATNMKLHTDLKMRKFDRIIFNFPHAGFHGKETSIGIIKMHRSVVRGFFRNASGMLRANGEIHVSHKTTFPFNRWNLEELASQNSLALMERVNFKTEDYPGYNNKRGAGPRSDDQFPLGECSTYKFRFSPHSKTTSRVLWSLDTARVRFQQVEEETWPVETLWNSPAPREYWQHRSNHTAYENNVMRSPPPVIIRNECSSIFPDYFSHVVGTFGRDDCDVYNSVLNALKLGFVTYMREVPGRDLKGYINLLEELCRYSISRSAWLQRMLDSDHRR